MKTARAVSQKTESRLKQPIPYLIARRKRQVCLLVIVLLIERNVVLVLRGDECISFFCPRKGKETSDCLAILCQMSKENVSKVFLQKKRPGQHRRCEAVKLTGN